MAVWVGFIALFGIATGDGVLMATYLDQSFNRNKTDNLKGIRAATVEAGQRRIKPAVMTTATGTPRPSSPTVSCRLHDVQDPQSPIAVITTSFSAAIWSSSSAGAMREKLSLV